MSAAPKTTMQPVLVDFGLAGRKLRPGCATAHYGAPEIWGLSPKGHVPRPADADVYAFACVAYEVLTGRTLFAGTSEVALLTAHLSHDGLPDALAGLARIDAPCSRLVDALSSALRRDPRERLGIRDLRAALANSARELAGRAWPLGSVSAAPSA
jgi:serine/threonine protein kinase